jgi:cytochrome oxidase assembly protein ShyY1
VTVLTRLIQYSRFALPEMTILLTFPITTGCLGIWQLYRLRQKGIQESINLDADDQVFSITGSFLPRHRPIGPRAYPIPYTKSASGFYIVQPFQPSTGPLMLVNRGWLPRKEKVDCPIDAKITGFTAKSERVCTCSRLFKAGPFVPKNQPGVLWTSIDVGGLAKELDTSPEIFEQTIVDEGFVARDRKVVHHHLEYAITWFGMLLNPASFAEN